MIELNKSPFSPPGMDIDSETIFVCMKVSRMWR